MLRFDNWLLSSSSSYIAGAKNHLTVICLKRFDAYFHSAAVHTLYNTIIRCNALQQKETVRCKIREHPAVQCSEVGDTLYMFDGVVKAASIGQLYQRRVTTRSLTGVNHCTARFTAQYFVLWMQYAYTLDLESHQISIRIEMQSNWIKMRLHCALCIALGSDLETTFAAVTWHSQPHFSHHNIFLLGPFLMFCPFHHHHLHHDEDHRAHHGL